MAKVVPPLTIMQINAAKPKAKEYNLTDGQGLYLQIRPNGSKRWALNYLRPYTKKRANMGLGCYPEVTLSEAREKRRDALNLLKNNVDPMELKEKQAQQQTEAHAETLEVVTRRWHVVKTARVSKDFAIDIIRSFEIHIFPSMGNTPISNITAKGTIEVLQPIANKGTLETVRRLCQRLNEVMTYATNTGLIKHNPLAGIKEAFINPTIRNMPAIPPEHLPELMGRIRGASIKTITRHLIEFQLHTMTRPSEAAGARWEEIDLKKKLWTIPPERMKAKRIHKIPLTDEVLNILKTMKTISGHREFIFPGDRNPTQHISEQTANMALRRMGYQDIQVAHGFRSIASTALNNEGFDSDLIECALAHVEQNEVRAAYNRSDYLARRKLMMCWWSDFITRASFGELEQGKSSRGLRAVS